MALYQLDDISPRLSDTAWVADSAQVIGNVEMAEGSSVWFGCVLRGDVGPIRLGARSNVQDLSCIHATDGISHTSVGEDVTVGHGVILHGCTVEDRALIGMGSIILDNAVIGAGSVVGAGSLVTQRTIIPPGTLVLGRPAKAVRAVTAEEARYGVGGAEHYVADAKRYRAALGMLRS